MRCAHPEDRLRRTTHDFAALERSQGSRGWSACADHDEVKKMAHCTSVTIVLRTFAHSRTNILPHATTHHPLPPHHVMVREGEPPTTLQHWTGAKEVVGGSPSQTMTALGRRQEIQQQTLNEPTPSRIRVRPSFPAQQRTTLSLLTTSWFAPGHALRTSRGQAPANHPRLGSAGPEQRKSWVVCLRRP